MTNGKRLINVVSIGILSALIILQLFGCAAKTIYVKERQAQLQSFVANKYTKKDILLKFGVPTQRLDVDGLEVWRYHFSHGNVHHEGVFDTVQSYEKSETIDLYFDGEQLSTWRYNYVVPRYETEEGQAYIVFLCVVVALAYYAAYALETSNY